MRHSLSDPMTLAVVAGLSTLVGGVLVGIWRQSRAAHVTADSLIVPPRRVYTTCDPTLREEAARRRARVEALQQRARRASAGDLLPHDVVPLRQRRQG